MLDDFYLLLGIGRDAGLTQIRRAYRRLSLRFHPEVAGEEGAEQFGRIREAYETLSHTTRRADYDRKLSAVGGRSLADEVLFNQPIDVMRDFGTVQPGTEQILAHILANFTHREPKSHPTRELNVEIALSAEQASKGGVVPLVVPVARVCPRCGGTGRTGFFLCDACDGHGTLWQKATVDVHIPQEVADGAVIETSLRHLGIRNMWLKTHVRVSAGMA